jgi:transposase
LRRGDVLRFFAGLSPCLVGMKACATAHHWARELARLGHTVRLMPPAYVKPYVKRGKTDAADAEAIAEAATRPTMRFVAVKTAEQQAILMLHKVRDLLVRQRTMLINALRGHLAEFGIVAARGPGGVTAAIAALHEAQDGLPMLAKVALHGLVISCASSKTRSSRWRSVSWRSTAPTTPVGGSRQSPVSVRSRRAQSPPPYPTPRFSNPAASSRLGSDIRRLLVIGATAVIRLARQDNASKAWDAKLLERKSARLVSVALANKTARIAWALLPLSQSYVAPAM